MSKNRKTGRAVYAGSFDPLTLGHVNVARRAAALFSGLTILVGENSAKTGLFSVEQRIGLIKRALADLSGLEIKTWSGLTTEFLRKEGLWVMVRGLRGSLDADSETALASMNQSLLTGVETVFLPAADEFRSISSSLVREVIRAGGDPSPFVPAEILPLPAPTHG